MTGGSGPALRDWVLDRLARLVPEYTGELTEETPLVDEGLCLDSINIMDLVTDIESALAIRIEEDDISPDNFGTVGRLLKFLESRR
jgi:acyl carrier protein